MAETTVGSQAFAPRSGGRAKFLVGGLLIIAAIVYLVVTSLSSTAQYFYTVDEIQAKGASLVGKNLRASGAVLGDTITYDAKTLTITFDVVHVSNDAADVEAAGGLAAALHNAASDPNATRMTVVYVGPKPDLLQNEAQAIVTGKLGEDGVFYADELLLKCPTRYEEAVPAQAEG
ncbi:MAG: cytochrome c maturation protein CcmE [Anaerolineales bacterium]|nr:cytochrome c maturation protein CcmE [Anaerolineales bacterium]